MSLIDLSIVKIWPIVVNVMSLGLKRFLSFRIDWLVVLSGIRSSVSSCVGSTTCSDITSEIC